MQSIGLTLRKTAQRMEYRLARALDQLMRRPPARRVVFLHIPKCAGSSVNMLFKAQLGSGSSRHVVILDDRLPKSELDDRIRRARDAQFVGGHFGIETLERIRGDAFTFTVLRDPFDRLRSIYGHLSTRTDVLPVGDKVHAMSLDDFLASEDEDVLQWTDNVMARMLAFAHRRENIAAWEPHALGKRAIENAAALDRILFLETLDAGIAPIAKLAGLRYGGALPRENITALKASAPPPPQAIERMASSARKLATPRISADMAVYSALRERK